MQKLNNRQNNIAAALIERFVEYRDFADETAEKFNMIAEKFRQGQFNELDAKVVQYLELIDAIQPEGRDRVSLRAVYDRFRDHLGNLKQTDEDPAEEVEELVNQLEDVLAPTSKSSDPRFTINERFEFIEDLVNMLNADSHKRMVNGVVVTGSGGLGKSYTVMEVLGHRDDVIVTKGHSSARALFDQLSQYPNAIHVFDDCDSVLMDKSAVNVLKAAIDTGERTVKWNTFAEDAEPFEFNGSIVFISNMELKDVPQPILSRSHFVDVTMTPDEKIERLEHILEDIPVAIGMEERRDVLELMRDLRYEIDDLNVRTFLKIAELQDSGLARWKDIATYEITTKVAK